MGGQVSEAPLAHSLSLSLFFISLVVARWLGIDHSGRENSREREGMEEEAAESFGETH